MCYPESVKARWMDLDSVSFAKMADPISWELARSEYLDNQLDDGLIVTFDNGSTYFNVHDIEIFLDESEKGYLG